jgi:mannose-6-phosphate isomerase-like protein (cupin superfamily)
MDVHDNALPLAERYWYLDGTDATRIDVDPAPFWQQLMTGAYRDEIVRRVGEGNGWLVGVYRMDADMTHEEMHPHGDELHFLVSGRVDLVLAPEDAPGAQAMLIRMTPGTSTVVPKGVWHRFVVHEPARGLAITAGRGTEHRRADGGSDA